MKISNLLVVVLFVASTILSPNPKVHSQETTRPIVSKDVVFEEKDGLVAVEAEHFFSQTDASKRAWHIQSTNKVVTIKPDGDPPHVAKASGHGYLEALPDTRRTHGDKLIKGENFSNEPGKMALVHYKVWINNPGRYYVWVRAFSTGTEDNGLHVGLDGQWPETGRRLQWTAKQKWFWDSKQRTEKVHTGVPGQIYLDIDKAGEHVISFSMREDGFEFDKWLMTKDKKLARPKDEGPTSTLKSGSLPKPFRPFGMPSSNSPESQIPARSAKQVRGPDGDGSHALAGERKTWHTVSVTLDGPFANENDQELNPFRDFRLTGEFWQTEGKKYSVPGYFAADGMAAQTSATSGNKWRVKFTPDKPGKWFYRLVMLKGKNSAIDVGKDFEQVSFKQEPKGEFVVTASDKKAPDFRSQGRLQYVGQRYLQFAGSQQYFLKAGADAPETLLAYADFDATTARKKNSPLKTFSPHLKDWKEGDPTWKSDKGKGLIGAINYLSGKGCNAFSFLTYNAGGDGDNVWPHVSRADKLHFDVSKLEQWGIVFDHATSRGMYLHFKLQETENDDNRMKKVTKVPMALDGGDLGVQRKLYLREIIARFGHNLACNWNLGEENTQSPKQQRSMAEFIKQTDPYGHLIVIHTFPDQQDKVYDKLIGNQSVIRGASLQNSHIRDTHWQTLKWVNKTAATGTPWVIAFDESGSAAHGQCPDLGYKGFDGKDSDGKMIYTQHEVRRQTLWGNLMAGGAGVEYYFGYKFVENDLNCEDWRSRDQSWDYCRIALEFFRDEKIPFWQMKNRNDLVGNDKNDNSVYCLAKPGQVYVVYVASDANSPGLELESENAKFDQYWFDPTNGKKSKVSTAKVSGGKVELTPPTTSGKDWVVVIRKSP